MKADQLAALTSLLSAYVELGNHRLQTLCLLITALVSARTVKLSHLAAERASEVLPTSSYRGLQRFFHDVRPPKDWAAKVILALSGARPPWLLCLDRTNWKIGKKEASILVMAIVTQRFRLPLMSRSAGAKRRRSGMAGPTFEASPLQAGMSRSAGAKRRRSGMADSTFETTGDGERLDLHVAARRFDGGELLIVAGNVPAANPVNASRKRRAIECLFGDTRTRGFNLEDTALTSADKLGLLLAVVALAVAWLCRTATDLMGKSAPGRKKHGHDATSWFRIGFDERRRRP